ncbi:hypothetical protein V7S43_006546 [Phytophthora oleae]|uniref:HAT C-terminal dimerisation domain-containing protein n=1 Tax=Phytophthora oleae TaxID=2107226 RepID=A0ABD3FNL0_9STRA
MTDVNGAIDEGRKQLREAHRKMFREMYAAAHEVDESFREPSPNFDLVPSMEDEGMLCGAPLELEDAGGRPLSSLYEEADEVLERWLCHSVPWVQVAVHQAAKKRMCAEVLTRLLLVRRNGTVCWSLQGVFKYVEFCQWFREVGVKQFPSIAALARIWLGRVSSNAFQERVFSTGGLIMSSLRTRTHNERAEMQVLLKQNRTEIKRLEADGGSAVIAADSPQIA